MVFMGFILGRACGIFHSLSGCFFALPRPQSCSGFLLLLISCRMKSNILENNNNNLVFPVKPGGFVGLTAQHGAEL